MKTVNKVILIGNITKDPIIKTTESGKKMALFTLATNRYYKTSEGEQKSESEFTSCIAWWSLADRCEQFLSKWKLVYSEWRLKTRIIEKETGERSYRTEVVIWDIIFLNKREDISQTHSELEDDDLF